MRFAAVHFVVLVSTLAQAAESAKSYPVVDAYVVRGAEQLNSPHVVTYRVAEWMEQRGRWILPDLGYYDTGYGAVQMWFAGGCGVYTLSGSAISIGIRKFSSPKKLLGCSSKNKRSLWIWPVVDVRFPPRLFGEVAAFPTIPLNKAQRWGLDIDRAKLERRLTSKWSAGIGYSGGICTARSWQSKPFVTVTRKTPVGSFEVWIQSIPGGSQAQLRYTLVRTQQIDFSSRPALPYPRAASTASANWLVPAVPPTSRVSVLRSA